MSEIVVLTAIAAAVATYYFYRRGQEPNHLREIYNGLKLKSELAKARGSTQLAQEQQEMADAILDAQRLIWHPDSRSAEDVNAICSRLFHASSSKVLDSLNIFDQNHRSDCYNAVLNLVGRLQKVHPK